MKSLHFLAELAQRWRVGREKRVQVRRQNLHRKMSSVRIRLEENTEGGGQDSQKIGN